MFWANKYSLYYRCQRPTPGGSVLNTTMYQIIFFGPMALSLGNYCWSSFIGNIDSGHVPKFVAIILSGVILLIPYKLILSKIVD